MCRSPLLTAAFDPFLPLANSYTLRAMRIFFVRLLLVGFASGVIGAGPTGAKERSWPCSWVHGRMTAGNGAPSTRIWPVGTHRMLGVVNPGDPDIDSGDMPDKVLNLLTREHDFTVWGDFYVCPVTPDRAGWMRFVVVKDARRLAAGRS
jgi:hypothetical protein